MFIQYGIFWIFFPIPLNLSVFKDKSSISVLAARRQPNT